MGFTVRTAIKDLRRRRRDPMGLLLWFAIPIFVGVMLKLAFGGPGAAPPRAHVLVVDEDDSLASQFLIGALSQGGDSSPFRGEKVSAEDGRRRIEAGEATALLVIPKGFGRAVLQEQPATLRLVTNPAQQILPALVKGGVELLPDVVFYAHRLFGTQLRSLSAMIDGTAPPQEADVGRLATELYRASRSLGATRAALPFGVEVVGDTPAKAQGPGFGEVFLPSLLFMSLFFVASGLSGDVWVERELGTLRRALQAPMSARAYFGGKVLAGAVLFALVTIVALALARWGFGLAISRLPAAALWATATGVVFLLIFTVLELHASSQRTAGFLVNLVLLPLLMLGGCFFPFEVMPDWMASVGRWTPNGWALVQLKATLAGQLTAGAFGLRLLGLGLLGCVLFFWALRRFAGRFAREA